MTIKIASSIETNAEKNVAEIARQFSDFSPRLVIFFASPKFHPGSIASAMQKFFGAANTVGCSTAGEIISGKMLDGAVVAMGFDGAALADVAIEIVENVSKENRVPEAFAGFERHVNKSMLELNAKEYVGMILIDGLSYAEEKIVEKIGDLTDILFVGGSAGDDLKFERTYIYANGKSYTDAAVLVLLKPAAGFYTLKTQSHRDTKKVLKATRVDEARRIVYEFNNEPAINLYARLVGIPVEHAELGFSTNPLGLMMGDEPFVRSPKQASGGAISFFCNVKEGMDLHLLERGDITCDTKIAVEKAIESMGGCSGMINFHCVLRTAELKKLSKTEEYGKIFEKVPAIGFSTYGEQYLGHINQTSAILLLR